MRNLLVWCVLGAFLAGTLGCAKEQPSPVKLDPKRLQRLPRIAKEGKEMPPK